MSKVMKRWLCRWIGHDWRTVGSADTGFCMATLSECARCNRESDRWPPE